MPELPEVEVHARNLRQWLLGRRVEAMRLHDPLLVLQATQGGVAEPPDRWDTLLVGQVVHSVRREAKYLLIDLANERSMVAHLRMTGRFVRDTYWTEAVPRFTRLSLVLDNGERVRFEDRRRFGRVWLTETAAVRDLPELAHLGPDALLVPITAEQLAEWCRGSRRSIKTLLLDQRVLGGLGNICVIEILYRAGIAPTTPADQLSSEQIAELARLIPEFLEWAIDQQSRRELLYIGEPGAENIFTIYRRAGEPCPKCGSLIVRGVVSGRGTYFCPLCQR